MDTVKVKRFTDEHAAISAAMVATSDKRPKMQLEKWNLSTWVIHTNTVDIFDREYLMEDGSWGEGIDG